MAKEKISTVKENLTYYGVCKGVRVNQEDMQEADIDGGGKWETSSHSTVQILGHD